MLNITTGKQNRPLKVVLYGSEGIGKSTVASQFPDPLFIDTEGGTGFLDVRRIDRPQGWEELIAIVREVAATPDICKTLVLDTADWAERLCADYVCQKYHQSSIEGFGYGKGYTYLSEEFCFLLTAMNAVIRSGKHVVVIAHAKMRKQELPDEAGAFDRWELKLSRQVAPILKEWCDLLLFANYKTYVVSTDNNNHKAQGGKRVMFASHHPCWDAKNRQGLPDEMDLDFANIAHLFVDLPSPAVPRQPVDQLRALLADAGITEEEFRKIVAAKKHYSEDTPIDEYSDRFLTGWCIKYFDQIKNIINADTNQFPATKED